MTKRLLLIAAILAPFSGAFAQSISIDYPNGGETLSHGATETIRWTSQAQSAPFVAVAIQKGAGPKVIVASTPNDGEFVWTVTPDMGVGTNYKIFIRSTTSPAIADTSDTVFSVVSTPVPPSLSLTRPQGGELFMKGSVQPITWITAGSVGASIRINLRQGDMVWPIAALAANIGSYSWTVPSDVLNGSDYVVEIVSLTTPPVFDVSEGGITLTDETPPDTPSVLLPASGASGVDLAPVCLGSDFFDLNETDYQASEQWQIAEGMAFSTLVYDAVDTDGVPDHQVMEGVLVEGTTYYVRVRYQDSAGLWSAWSAPSSFTTAGEGAITRDVFVLPGDVQLEMITIPDGTFTMGSATGRWVERPVHAVTISNAFQMGRFEVTKAQWTAVMGTTPWAGRYPIPLGPNTPATHINWNMMQTFCAVLSGLTGETFRLPTEAEWEYACRAGSPSDYCFGNDLALLNDYGWCANFGPDHPMEVGQLFPNAWGLYDMHGGVREWCQDVYSDTYYTSTPVVDPQGPATGTQFVFRGGAWDDAPLYCRSAQRSGAPPLSAGIHMGFRVVREIGGP